MDAERIFHEAVDITDPVQRAAYLDRTCAGNDQLRSQVEALLRADARAGSFLEAPPAGAGATLDQTTRIDGPGTVIGRYELLELIGEGGMGLVYLAEQKEPIRRRVALKIIKPGMDSRQVIARFEAERQALALLDHPNVAHVFDAGCTETGRPYFVMEYVKGLSITRYCDDHRLTIEQRLRLFEQVCEAVHHAHQKGIIHRDLKPSNILVCVHDDRPVPKIIDFGIAKAITQPLTDKTFVTFQGQLLGTPEYMSPEQVDLATQDIDTRTDIYSLGIILYELLAGVLPFESDAFERAGLLEIQQTIREQEPASPSLRLTTLGEKAKTIAASRGTQVVPLARRLHRELEWIPLKAIRKDRCRRYRSASEMADDLRNYLTGLPLLAGPETTIYRVQKFVRKHAGSVATAALVAAAIILGLVVSTVMYFRSEQSRGREAAARTQAEEAKQKETTARMEAEAAREKEQQARAHAERAEETTRKKAEELRLASYYEKIRLADRELADGEIFLATMRLESCPSDLHGWEWHHLWQICRSAGDFWCLDETSTLLSMSADGNRIGVGRYSGIPVVWDVETRSKVMSINADLKWRYGRDVLALNADGTKLVSVSDDIIKLWDVATGSCIKTCTPGDKPIKAIALSPDGLRVVWSEGAGGSIMVWDTDNETEPLALCRDWAPGSSVAYSRNGARILTVGGGLRVWNAADGKLLQDFSKSTTGSSLSPVAISANGRLVAFGGSASIGIWDVETGNQTVTIPIESAARHIALDPNGTRVVWADSGGMIRVSNMTSDSKEEFAIRGHAGGLSAIAFSRDGRQIVSLDGRGMVGVWRLSKRDAGMPTLAGDGTYGGVGAIAFSADRKQFAETEGLYGRNPLRGRLCIQDLTGGDIRRFDPNLERVVRVVSFSPNGAYIVAGDDKGTIKVLDSVTGDEKWKTNVNDSVTALAFSLDNRHFASCSGRGDVTMWDLARPTPIHIYNVGYGGKVVEFYPDGTHVLGGGWFYLRGETRSIVVWDTETGAQAWTSMTPGVVTTVSFRADGKRIVSGDTSGAVAVWDSKSGESIWLSHHGTAVGAVDFSPDGRRIISGGANETVKVWDADTGIALSTLEAQAQVKTVGFSRPDGKLILAGCHDGKVRIWDSNKDTHILDAEYWRQRGRLYRCLRYYDQALSALTRAVEIDPNDSESYGMRGRVHMARQHYAKAIEDFGRVIQADPNNAVYLNERVTAYLRTRQDALATADFERLIQIHPDDKPSISPYLLTRMNDAAWRLGTDPAVDSRDGPKAVKLATILCKLTDWQEDMYLDTLAAAYAETGKFESAITYQEQAISLLRGRDALEKEKNDYETRLGLYKSGKPYRAL